MLFSIIFKDSKGSDRIVRREPDEDCVCVKKFFVKNVFHKSVSTYLADIEVDNEMLYMIDWLRKIEVFAISNASVRTSQNLNPPAPLTYLYTSSINGNINDFKVDSTNYYEKDLPARLKDDIAFILQRKVKQSGKGVSSSGIGSISNYLL